MEELLSRLKELSDVEKSELLERLFDSKSESKGEKKNRKTVYINIPHKSCDNCHNACLTQNPNDLTELIPDCPHLPTRFFVKEINRLYCPHWERKRVVYEEEGEEWN